MNFAQVKPWLRLCRAPNTFTAAADVFAGAALVGAPIFGWRALATAAGSMLIYAGGVALNDVQDVAKDRTLHPDRPLPLGQIPVATARRVAIALIAVGVATSLLAPWPAFFTSLALAAAVLAYDLAPESSAVAAPILMGAARGLNLLRGAALVAVTAPAAVTAATFHAALAACITLVSLHEDRPANAAEPPRLKTALLALPWLYTGPALIAARLDWFTALILLGGAAALSSFVLAPSQATPRRVDLVVPRAVFTLTLIDAGYVFATGSPFSALLVAALFLATIATRRASAQRGS
jgi:4-hydroxybenzoate polyprenyltransferase